MASYADKHFDKFVPEDSLKEDILCQNSVPDNLDNVKKLDDFLRDILNTKNVKQTNKILEMFWKSDGSSVEIKEYSRGSKRDRRRFCPNICK